MKTALRAVTLLVLAGGVVGVAAVAAAQPATNTAEPSSNTDQSAPVRDVSAPPDTPVTGVVANMRFDLSNSSQGSFMQLVPDIGYKFNTWGLDVGVPLDSSSASATATAATSHRGVGDMYLSVYYAADSDAVYWKSTLTGTAPTGDPTVGLGTGQATWNWTNHFDHDFDWISPFVDAGVGNSINASTTVSARTISTHGARHVSRPIMIPTEPYTTVGKLANLDAGVGFQVWRALGFSLSAYDIIPWGDQTVLSRFIPQPKQTVSSVERPTIPISRSTKGQRSFEVSSVTQGTASLTRDNGFGASVTASPRSYFDVTVNYSRSVPMKLDVLSLSIGTNLTALFR